MKERQIDFNRNDDPTTVALSDKDKKEAMKEAQDLCMAANEIYTYLKEDKLAKGYCETILSLLESYTVKLHEKFDFQSVMRKEHEERSQRIRAINAENRELRKQLGEKVTPEDVREQLKNFNSIIQEWWKKEGLGYVKEISFHGYICSVKVSGSMSIHFEEKHPEELRKKGYDLAEPERGSFELVASDANIALITKEIKTRFPSAEIWEIIVKNWRALHLDYIEFHIRDFSDFIKE